MWRKEDYYRLQRLCHRPACELTAREGGMVPERQIRLLLLLLRLPNVRKRLVVLTCQAETVVSPLEEGSAAAASTLDALGSGTARGPAVRWSKKVSHAS